MCVIQNSRNLGGEKNKNVALVNITCKDYLNFRAKNEHKYLHSTSEILGAKIQIFFHFSELIQFSLNIATVPLILARKLKSAVSFELQVTLASLEQSYKIVEIKFFFD